MSEFESEREYVLFLGNEVSEETGVKGRRGGMCDALEEDRKGSGTAD